MRSFNLGSEVFVSKFEPHKRQGDYAQSACLFVCFWGGGGGGFFLFLKI
jgi:hypothetical protein